MPVVSIGMPVFNGEAFISEAIESILAQEFEDFELIISDNASTDRTPEICQSYAANDDRIRFTRLPENMGAAHNYNRVFHLSTGEFFKWASHDDRLHPRFLVDCVEAFSSQDAPLALVHPIAEIIGPGGDTIRSHEDRLCCLSASRAKRVFECVQSIGMVTSVFGLYHRETLAKSRLIGSYISSDLVLLVEIATLGKILCLNGEPRFQRRVHEGMSRVANTKAAELMAWFDPNASLRLPPSIRLRIEFLRSMFVLPGVGASQRSACLLAVTCGSAFKSVRKLIGR